LLSFALIIKILALNRLTIRKLLIKTVIYMPLLLWNIQLSAIRGLKLRVLR
jgi:hypothetical protein